MESRDKTNSINEELKMNAIKYWSQISLTRHVAQISIIVHVALNILTLRWIELANKMDFYKVTLYFYQIEKINGRCQIQSSNCL